MGAAGRPRRGSAQLAVLAAAAVVAAGRGFVLHITRLLAVHAQAYAGHGLAPRLWDFPVALLTATQAGPLRPLAAHSLDRVLDGRVDLVLDGALACPLAHGRTSRGERVGPYVYILVAAFSITKK